MPGKIIDKNGNEDTLTDTELIAAQSAVIKIREKRHKEEEKTALKIAEMREKEKIKEEREARRATIRASERSNLLKARRQELNKKTKVAAKIREEKAGDRKSGDTTKAEKAEEMRQQKKRDSVFKAAKRVFEKEEDRDAEDYFRLRNNRRTKQEAKREGTLDRWEISYPDGHPHMKFVDMNPLGVMDAIIDGVDLCFQNDSENINNYIESMGLQIVDDGAHLAVICDDPSIKTRLNCSSGYNILLYEHPQMIDRSRAVWFGDRLERCIIFSLPFEGAK